MSLVSHPDAIQPSLRKGWKCYRLGDVAEIVSGITLGRKLNGAPTRPVPYLRVANVKDGYLDLSDVYEIHATEAEIAKYTLRRGDLLLTEGGDADKLGRGAYWNGEIPECIHQNHIFRARLDPTAFDPRFLSALLQSPYAKAYFLSYAKQATGIATINSKVLSGFPLMAPSLAAQKRIAARLAGQISAVERARAAVEAPIGGARQLPESVLLSIFNGQEGESWPLRKLGDIAEVSGGLQKSPDRSPSSFHRPYLTVRNVQRGALDLSKVERFEVTPEELERCRLLPGDLLIVEGNGSLEHIGRNAVYGGGIEDCIHQNHLIRARSDPSEANPWFVGLYLNSALGRAQMVEKARTSQVLFLQHVLASLKPQGRCGIVLDEGVLFKTNETAFVQTKRKLLDDCEVWAIVSLPQGVFGSAGSQSVKTNLVFFTKGRTTERIWYYDLSHLKVGKTSPLTLEHFTEFFELLPTRGDGDHSWTVDIAARRAEARRKADPLRSQAQQREAEALQAREQARALRAEKRPENVEVIAELKAKASSLQAEARELRYQAQAIEDAVLDLKAVNPNAQTEGDRRTPQQLLDFIREKGREADEALAVLEKLIATVQD